MNKIKKKLSLNKKTIASLDDSEMSMVKGGFTYALSTGRVCKLSIGLGWGKELCQEQTPSLTEAVDQFNEQEPD